MLRWILKNIAVQWTMTIWKQKPWQEQTQKQFFFHWNEMKTQLKMETWNQMKTQLKMETWNWTWKLDSKSPEKFPKIWFRLGGVTILAFSFVALGISTHFFPILGKHWSCCDTMNRAEVRRLGGACPERYLQCPKCPGQWANKVLPVDQPWSGREYEKTLRT